MFRVRKLVQVDIRDLREAVVLMDLRKEDQDLHMTEEIIPRGMVLVQNDLPIMTDQKQIDLMIEEEIVLIVKMIVN